MGQNARTKNNPKASILKVKNGVLPVKNVIEVVFEPVK